MNIKESLKKILDEWSQESKTPFPENQLADFIRNGFVKSIEENIEIKGMPYIIKASAGAGNWANIPWLAILDPKVTSTTREGVNPVFLFKANGEGVYLSLNQGTTIPNQEFGKRRAMIRAHEIAEILRERIVELHKWDYKPLELLSKSPLGKSYEEPNIGYKYYPKSSLPSNDELKKDLNDLLNIYSKVAKIWKEVILEVDNLKQQIQDEQNAEDFNLSPFLNDLSDAGIIAADKTIFRYISSLLSKNFAILTGLSGSGKTKLAEAFSSWISLNCDEQICFVPVGADWTNREPLLGYPNALNMGEYVKPETGALDIILRAANDIENPYFLILDEMNLSHVERYFADFLSAMESVEKLVYLRPKGEDWNNCEIPSKVKIPDNLFIIGTVNIDETTYMFSPKVLDRANVIEFRVDEDDMNSYFEQPTEINMIDLSGAGASMAKSFVEMANIKGQTDDMLKDEIMPFFSTLQEAGAEFGYRTASEMSRFVKICTEISEGKMTRDEIVDAAIMQKLLPKLHGSRNRIERILVDLGKLCITTLTEQPFAKDDSLAIKYPLSYDKLKRMHKRAVSDGFTSYAEA